METVPNPAAIAAFLAEATPLILAPVAELVKARQEQMCPRDTHTTRHMADHIGIRHGEGYVDVGPEKPFFYGRFVELGSGAGTKPQPFIRPSVNL